MIPCLCSHQAPSHRDELGGGMRLTCETKAGRIGNPFPTCQDRVFKAPGQGGPERHKCNVSDVDARSTIRCRYGPAKCLRFFRVFARKKWPRARQFKCVAAHESVPHSSGSPQIQGDHGLSHDRQSVVDVDGTAEAHAIPSAEDADYVAMVFLDKLFHGVVPSKDG